MKDYLKIKKKLYEACLLFVNKKHHTVSTIIEFNKKALFSETKSSAGDKHETGRAMLQLEMEKASQQLASITEMKDILAKIEIQKTSEVICLGSLIITTKANYFLAISAGEISFDNKIFYAVSTNSPIGMQLLGKKVGERITFNNAKILEVY
ncbi:3-oxoacyl-ACP synthase [Lutibacter profundi]|uniref:3-oxoacyl-ACP synthase n=1 Tax=Lutibacter profundi TaxID=1622118 RepID=A0A0X8G7U6_9FLAO|nr:GreA/GreB family elongation factor [Lutibacter profundi]AMC11273.1 3-oxoacyl-ACP synthase [Lutibacter profundi]